jgi:hypothetical protein
LGDGCSVGALALTKKMRKKRGKNVEMLSRCAVYACHTTRKEGFVSWKTLNHILGLAAVDQQFWQELKKDPLAASQQRGFELTEEEKAVFSKIDAETLSEFSQRLLDAFGDQNNPVH